MKKPLSIILFLLFCALTIYFTINAPIVWKDKDADYHNALPAILFFIIALSVIVSYFSNPKRRNEVSKSEQFIRHNQ